MNVSCWLNGRASSSRWRCCGMPCTLSSQWITRKRRMALRELLQFGAENHRAFVAVRVDQRQHPASVHERGFQDRQHRRDAAAAREQQQVAVERARREHAGRRQHVERIARLHAVAQPVRRAAVAHALDGDLRRGVDAGRARQRITARDGRVRARHVQRQELAGPVREGVAARPARRTRTSTRRRFRQSRRPRSADGSANRSWPAPHVTRPHGPPARRASCRRRRDRRADRRRRSSAPRGYAR